MRTIAALYVDPKGCYQGLPSVDLWDEQRDARTYAGPHPVVAHPPCSRWCRLAWLVEARWGHKRGEDDGCFEAALEAVRRFGGVLEHPAYSSAWPTYGIPDPGYTGWEATICGGWTCYVEQGRYGHLAKKATWLYMVGAEPPPMKFGRLDDVSMDHPSHMVSWCANRSDDTRPRIGKRAAAATPVEFRDVLIGIARSVKGLGHD